MKKTVLIADDHSVYRKGLVDMLNKVTDLEIIAETGDGTDAYDKIVLQKPALAILDMEMSGMSGLEVARKAMKEQSSTRFIIMTMHREDHYFNEALQIGISGYLIKDNAFTELLMCVSQVLKGKRFLSPGIENQSALKKRPKVIPALTKLTATEKLVLKLIAECKTSVEIAALLLVSPNTIDNHRSNTIKKLGIKGKNSLLKFAIQHKSLL
jgi:two-component system, NarL family, response regulator DegU